MSVKHREAPLKLRRTQAKAGTAGDFHRWTRTRCQAFQRMDVGSMLANERTRPPTNIVKPLTWRVGCPARIETGPPAGFLKLQKSGAGRWYLELDRGLFLDGRVPAGDIYPADMVGGSLGSLSLLSGTRGAVRRRGLAF